MVPRMPFPRLWSGSTQAQVACVRGAPATVLPLPAHAFAPHLALLACSDPDGGIAVFIACRPGSAGRPSRPYGPGKPGVQGARGVDLPPEVVRCVEDLCKTMHISAYKTHIRRI